MTCRKFLTFVDRHTKKFGSGFQLSKKALKTAYVALKKRGGEVSLYQLIRTYLRLQFDVMLYIPCFG